MCRAVSSEILAKVKPKEVSDEFILQKGIRQEDIVAAVLFSLTLEISIQNACIDTSNNFFKRHGVLVYSNDIIIT
jgi:hypothetical protein